VNPSLGPVRPIAPAFAPLKSDALDNVAGLPPRIEVAPGRVFYNQGEIPRFIGLLHSGLIKLTHIDGDGRQTILGLRSSGWFLGLANTVTNSISVCTAVAITSCVISEFEPQDFSAKLHSNAGLMEHFIFATAQEIVTTRHLLTQLMSSSAERRLNVFLEEAATDNSLWKTIDAAPELKQLEIAQLLSITPEHLSRLMSKAMTGREGQSAVQAARSYRPKARSKKIE
jgi:CRP-like cAMP-binding protein